MTYMYVRHRVADFDQWLRVFESHGEAQAESGLRDPQVLREASDPNIVVVFFRVEDLATVRAFIETPEAEKGKVDSGVIGDPEGFFLEEI